MTIQDKPLETQKPTPPSAKDKDYGELIAKTISLTSDIMSSEAKIQTTALSERFKTFNQIFVRFAFYFGIFFVGCIFLHASVIWLLGTAWGGRYWLSSLAVGLSVLLISLARMAILSKRIKSVSAHFLDDFEHSKKTLSHVADGFASLKDAIERRAE